MSCRKENLSLYVKISIYSMLKWNLKTKNVLYIELHVDINFRVTFFLQPNVSLWYLICKSGSISRKYRLKPNQEGKQLYILILFCFSTSLQEHRCFSSRKRVFPLNAWKEFMVSMFAVSVIFSIANIVKKLQNFFLGRKISEVSGPHLHKIKLYRNTALK